MPSVHLACYHHISTHRLDIFILSENQGETLVVKTVTLFTFTSEYGNMDNLHKFMEIISVPHPPQPLSSELTVQGHRQGQRSLLVQWKQGSGEEASVKDVGLVIEKRHDVLISY